MAKPCESFIPIGKDGYGFCPEHERHVSTPPYDPTLKSLCDYCQVDDDGHRHVSKDVYFYQHDLVGLHSEHQKAIESMEQKAALMQLAPKILPAPLQDQVRKVPKSTTKKVVKKSPSLLDFGGVTKA